MDKPLIAQVDASVICITLFVLMLLTVALGNRMRRKFWSAEEGDAGGGVNSLLGALFGLWSFILAFSFGQSGARFENVRSMIVDEGNILRTTILKADFFPDSVRDTYRVELRKYLEERISYYEFEEGTEKFKKNREALSETATALWKRTVRLSKNSVLNAPANGMASALSTLFDIGIRREAVLTGGIPSPISFMLITLALTISLVGGFTTATIKRKEWIVVTVFALLASTILFITIDLARPMEGLIKPDAGQNVIVALRKLF